MARLRILTKSYYDFNGLKYLNKYLTYYQQHSQSESHKFKIFKKMVAAQEGSS